MKKCSILLLGVCVVSNLYAEEIVLSDTSLGQASSQAPTANTYYVSQSESYVSEQLEPAFQNSLANDTSDPLFLTGKNQFLFDSYITTVNSKVRLGQYVGYGINDKLRVHANMLYQLDFSGADENGFSSTEFGGTYRMSDISKTDDIIYDVLFGLKLWGSSHVRTPEYADSSYYAGLRLGRQYSGVSFSGTVKSTWVFDDVRGLSYIDFIPEVYFRFKYDWHAGLGFDFRKSTNTQLLSNQEWLNFKLLRQYGNTQYVGSFGYEFESSDIQFSANVKILF